jgi:subfamily B ATP-binding cassette protein MsbA
MTVGLFFSFVYCLIKSYEPIKRMGAVYQQFQQAQGATTHVFAYLDLKQEEQDAPGAKPLPPFSREIEFQNVGFSYDTTPVLRDVSFQARRGELVAFVGSSGAGKTTLVNLIPRFYAASSGTIRVDGADIRDVTLRSLRGQIAMVTQENILFHDTVRNNICYGMSNVPQERVIQAAQAALAHDFILELPEGYDTLIGERGTRLSGGQRQRIAIARALLKDTPILLLDEATSSLDGESEEMIRQALDRLMQNRTVIAIAHRLSTLRSFDRIVVMESGHIMQDGPPNDLLRRDGPYRALVQKEMARLSRVAA